MYRTKLQHSNSFFSNLFGDLRRYFYGGLNGIFSRRSPSFAFLTLLSICLFLPLKHAEANSEEAPRTIEELIAQQRLMVTVSTNLDEPAIVGQSIKVSIEVATERWFSKGTRLTGFEAQNVVILPFEQLAINGSRSINRQTWTTQTREFTFYPTKAGRLQLPPIGLFISINGDNNKVIEGSLALDIEAIDVGYPSTLTEKDAYIVSSDFSLKIQSDAKSEGKYAVGDAVTVTYLLEADGIPGMMLPQIQIDANDGVSIYRKPAEVNDKRNRGSLVGTRVESFSFIFEKSGDYTFPDQKLLWWDINAKELKEVVVPEQTFEVSGLLPNTRSRSYLDFLKSPKIYAGILLLAFVIYALFKLYAYRIKLSQFYRKAFNIEQRKSQKQFIESIKKEAWLDACELLYQVHALPSKDTKALRDLFYKDSIKVETLNKLFNFAFYEERNAVEDKNGRISNSERPLSFSEAKALLKPSLPDSTSATDDLLKLN